MAAEGMTRSPFRQAPSGHEEHASALYVSVFPPHTVCKGNEQITVIWSMSGRSLTSTLLVYEVPRPFKQQLVLVDPVHILLYQPAERFHDLTRAILRLVGWRLGVCAFLRGEEDCTSHLGNLMDQSYPCAGRDIVRRRSR